jgi:glycoside/pentoside/hexuronide:cation symporter, GPH family
MSDATSAGPAARLSLRTKLGFGVCDLGGNLFFTALGFWALKYLTDTVGIAAAVAGSVIMVGKLVDAFWDPILGFLSDRTRTRWGRRRPYILLGSIPLAFAMWWFFTNPRIQDPVLLAVWAAASFILLNMAYSVVNIPYSSLTPELTADYNERSSLNGFRFVFAGVGTLLGAALVQPLLSAFGGGQGADKSLGFSVMGALFGAVMIATSAITAFSVREPKAKAEAPRAGGLLKTYLSVFRNKPFLVILFTYALNIVGLNFLMSVIAYYFAYIFANEGLTFVAMSVLLVTAIASIPISVLVSKRIGKKRTYQICFLVMATACLVIFFLGHILGPWFFIAMMVYAGIGLGFGFSTPFAMVPDAIELDAIETGVRKEGAFYGMWLFVSKVGAAFAIFATGLVLDAGRFVPNMAQGEPAKLAIRLAIGPIPAIFLLGAMFLVQAYPLDEKTYKAIVDKKAAQAR